MGLGSVDTKDFGIIEARASFATAHICRLKVPKGLCTLLELYTVIVIMFIITISQNIQLS